MDTLCRFQCLGPGPEQSAREEAYERVLRLLDKHFSTGTSALEAFGRLNAVLCGSAVLALVEQGESERYEDIDVITGRHTFYRYMEYLYQQEGGVMKNIITEVPALAKGSYLECVLVKTNKTRVRVIRGCSDSPLCTVTQYYSTHLINFVARDRLTVAYPTFTFVRQGILLDADRTVGLPTCTYTVRPAEVLVPNRNCSSCAVCGARWRMFGDSTSATIMFHGEDPLAGCGGEVKWKIGGATCGPNCTSAARMVAHGE